MSERPGLEQRIRERVQRDPDFRERLIADPRATLAADEGIDVPPSLTIRVVEEAVSEIVLVLPSPRAAVEDVTDAELEAVSGAGTGWGSCHDTCANRGCTGTCDNCTAMNC